jgi:hypothetical protein
MRFLEGFRETYFTWAMVAVIILGIYIIFHIHYRSKSGPSPIQIDGDHWPARMHAPQKARKPVRPYFMKRKI